MRNIVRIVVILLMVGLLALKNCSKTTPITQSNSVPNQPVPTASTNTNTARNSSVPVKVYDILKYVREHNAAPNGYEGGRHFGNFEGHLAETDASGRKINYQEWDVNPHLKHKNRGVERLITGSDGSAYYTNDHYNTFIDVK